MEVTNQSYRKDVVLNYVYKIVGMLLSLYSSRITIHYLGQSLYGHWATILSIVSWMSSGDFGIGNGLRNKLAEEYAHGNVQKQRALISAALTTLIKIAPVLILIFIAVCQVLLGFGVLNPIEQLPMIITLVFFGVNLVLGISQSIAYAYQKSWYCTFSGVASTVITILFIVGLNFARCAADLVIIAVVHGIAICIPNIILFIILRKQHKEVFSGLILGKSDMKTRSNIANVGIQFFIIQLCGVVLYATDNVMIEYLIDPISVTKYSVITKVYDMGHTLFYTLLSALWSAVTFRLASKDFMWIKRNIRNILLVWVVYVIGVAGVSLLFNPIVKIWLGSEAIYYEPDIVFLFALYGAVNAFSSIFVIVINGMGRIKLQMYVGIVCAIINIPLSVFFAEGLCMGIFGIKLGTFVCAVVIAIIMPIQAIYEIRKAEKQSLLEGK